MQGFQTLQSSHFLKTRHLYGKNRNTIDFWVSPRKPHANPVSQPKTQSTTGMSRQKPVWSTHTPPQPRDWVSGTSEVDTKVPNIRFTHIQSHIHADVTVGGVVGPCRCPCPTYVHVHVRGVHLDARCCCWCRVAVGVVLVCDLAPE